jgi:hypothetical protein
MLVNSIRRLCLHRIMHDCDLPRMCSAKDTCTCCSCTLVARQFVACRSAKTLRVCVVACAQTGDTPLCKHNYLIKRNIYSKRNIFKVSTQKTIADARVCLILNSHKIGGLSLSTPDTIVFSSVRRVAFKFDNPAPTAMIICHSSGDICTATFLSGHSCTSISRTSTRCASAIDPGADPSVAIAPTKVIQGSPSMCALLKQLAGHWAIACTRRCLHCGSTGKE